MAGEEGWRFGGFMDATWRGNDLIWGRLDAVENIFHQLLPKGRDDELFKTCVEAEQKRIVCEMKNKFGKGIVSPLSKQDPAGAPPHEDLLIGKQNLSSIPEEKKIRWMKLGFSRLIRTIRLPGLRLPRWSRRKLAQWTRTAMSHFFGNVLGRPLPAALRLAGVLVGIIVALSLFGAWALSQALSEEQWKNLPPLVGWTGEIVAVFWLLCLALTALMIAIIATAIRIGLLKIKPPSHISGSI
jgi:hypothetical protein